MTSLYTSAGMVPIGVGIPLHYWVKDVLYLGFQEGYERDPFSSLVYERMELSVLTLGTRQTSPRRLLKRN